MERTRTYFTADVHIGACDTDRRVREDQFCRWLESVRKDAKAVYLLGDIFDFWYEWRRTVPSCYTRALGALADTVDSGVEVFFFKGNHDMWVYRYFQEEIGIRVLEQPSVVEIAGKRFCLGHGDGLGKTDLGFRFLRGVFRSRFAQALFSMLHPSISMKLGTGWAGRTRRKKKDRKYEFRGEGNPLFAFCDEFGKNYRSEHGGQGIDRYIFGHYHTPGSIAIPSGGTMHIMDDWSNSGANGLVFDEKDISLQSFSERARVVE
ncbi:MAG: UDP-2,3-diacylglucosamine diphosphatase [Bacteroidales bacterium]|nr:UDP-2,3-diacylglucosamine diphosphatase [Bacteroidales bacterium]